MDCPCCCLRPTCERVLRHRQAAAGSFKKIYGHASSKNLIVHQQGSTTSPHATRTANTADTRPRVAGLVNRRYPQLQQLTVHTSYRFQRH